MNDPRRIPISQYMSPATHFSSPSESVSAAYAKMREHHIRHLPVVEDGRLVGLVFKSDLSLLEFLPTGRAEDIPVSRLMIREVYTVDGDEALDVAARHMSRNKYGSAIVVDQGKVVGVFTNTDALRALSDALTASLPSPVLED